MGSRDFYVILEVERTASQAELKAAYRRLARRYHPDQNQDDPAAEEHFKRVAAAYEVLGDPQRRVLYDRFGTDRPIPNGVPHGFQQINPIAVVVKQGVEALRARVARRSGVDLRINISLSFEEALRGTERVFALPRGAGKRQVVERRVEFRLPGGLSDGQVLRWAGYGGPGKFGGPSGDLYVQVSVAAHPLYRLERGDLIVPLPVRSSEAIPGEFEVPTLYGFRRVTLNTRPEHKERIVLNEAGRPVQGGRRHPLIVEIIREEHATSAEEFAALETRFERYVDALRKRAR